MENNALNRLNQVIKKLNEGGKNLSQKQIASDLGYKRETTISEIVNGKISLSTKFVKAFCQRYGVSEEYINSGEGEMFLSGSSMQQQQPHNKGTNAQTDFGQSVEDESTIGSLSIGDQMRRRKAMGTDEDERGLIYVPIAAQAGYSRHFMDNIYLNQLDRLFIPGLPYKGDNYRYFDVEGDSMEPTMQEGMQVIAEKVEKENWVHIRNYYVYVVVFIDRIAIKRLFKKDERSIVLISDNEALYQQELANIEEIKELWLVKRKIDWNIMPPKQFEIKL